VDDLFAQPKHPYTSGLLASIPRIRPERLSELPVIPGMVPDLLHLPAGCRFADRCRKAADICTQERPALAGVAGISTEVACYDPD
jgi:oligopeptide/dipeptide ABC transporter ATP-binding protein